MGMMMHRAVVRLRQQKTQETQTEVEAKEVVSNHKEGEDIVDKPVKKRSTAKRTAKK